MDKPETGQLDTCAVCGEELRYEGRFWQHTQSAPRHQPMPKIFGGNKDPLDPKGDV